MLSALCLLLPLPFAGKLAAGVSMLFGSMALALLRLGPDRIPFEVWLLRRLRFRLAPRRFVYHLPGWKLKARRVPVPAPAEVPVQARLQPLREAQTGLRPAALALPERGIYPLVSLLLAVLGVYFVAWLAQGGAEEIGAVFR